MNEKDPIDIAVAPAPSTSNPAIIAVELAPSDTPIDDDEARRRAIEQIWWKDNFEAFATPLRSGDFSQAEGQLAEIGYVRKANSNVGLEPIFDIQMTSALGRQLGLLNLMSLIALPILARSAGFTNSAIESVQLGLYFFIGLRIAFTYRLKLMRAVSYPHNLLTPTSRGMGETSTATFCWPRTWTSITRCLYTPRLQTLRERFLPRWKRHLINILALFTFCAPGIIFAFYHIAVVTVVVWYPNHTSVSNKPAHYHPIFELLSPLSFLLPALMLDFSFTYLPHIAERRGFRREEHAIIAGWTDKMRRLLLIANPIRERQVVRERKEEMDAWKKEGETKSDALKRDELAEKTVKTYASRSEFSPCVDPPSFVRPVRQPRVRRCRQLRAEECGVRSAAPAAPDTMMSIKTWTANSRHDICFFPVRPVFGRSLVILFSCRSGRTVAVMRSYLAARVFHCVTERNHDHQQIGGDVKSVNLIAGTSDSPYPVIDRSCTNVKQEAVLSSYCPLLTSRPITQHNTSAPVPAVPFPLAPILTVKTTYNGDQAKRPPKRRQDPEVTPDKSGSKDQGKENEYEPGLKQGQTEREAQGGEASESGKKMKGAININGGQQVDPAYREVGAGGDAGNEGNLGMEKGKGTGKAPSKGRDAKL
ncbi:uncharacterized protein MKK02DRAFT_32750 [Dioszegia hungarica]|uniref:Uncharacterized protein n=1 Tax=Dioszegia hungarica TaxID=4972 RepID=A0AA38LS21_9TREE|nr:uncharacterized protein MKK02DRAFT_32750 [Dioszegia hungarica]KAI9635292.1 hypothetical protein MKK02DRAFT_32750 [Dioszegia hungarica]